MTEHSDTRTWIRILKAGGAAAVILLLTAGSTRAEKQQSAASQTAADSSPIPPEARFKKEYIVLPGDQLDIVVRRVPEATRTVMVRADGTITLPLVNEVSVAGLSTREVEAKLVEILSKRLVRPEVTVASTQSHQSTVYIAGEVNIPGAVPLRNAATAMQALAFSGGIKRTGSARGITIIRLDSDGKLETIRLGVNGMGQRAPYEALARTRLFADDVIFVPESGRSQLSRFIDDFINHPLQGADAVIATWVNYKLIQVIDKSLP